jgi:hypothetical protein
VQPRWSHIFSRSPKPNSRAFVPHLSAIPTLEAKIFRSALLWLLVPFSLAGCLGAHHLKEVVRNPYPLTYQDDSTARFGDPDDDVFIEVRRTKVSKPLDNLAVHYGTLFPGGEVVRPGDTEEYVKVGDKDAYKVVFKTKYIRKRKRIGKGSENLPPEWSTVTMPDPETGKSVPVLYGPVVHRERRLYLVPGESEVYAIFMRSDGDTTGSARKIFEKFVREDIKYQ